MWLSFVWFARSHARSFRARAHACVPCVLNATFQNASGQQTCHATTVCGTDQWETVAPTLTSDRECTDHRTCNEDEWEKTAAGTHHNRLCVGHTVCNMSTHYVCTGATC